MTSHYNEDQSKARVEGLTVNFFMNSSGDTALDKVLEFIRQGHEATNRPALPWWLWISTNVRLPKIGQRVKYRAEMDQPSTVATFVCCHIRI